MQLDPERVLDVGPGFGKWGVLIREYLELWRRSNYKKTGWVKTIDCCEAFKDYLSPLHKYIYNNIINQPIEEYVKTMPAYDLVVMVDVFEHLTTSDGLKLINDLMQKTKHLIISVPAKWSAQGAAYGNIYEIHKSLWSYKEFEELGFKRLSKLEDPVTVIKSN
jgi:2-polyprenyl-3-methyl-5-hydroxy-6-metoxy-1,4-benzoquinol methylase